MASHVALENLRQQHQLLATESEIMKVESVFIVLPSIVHKKDFIICYFIGCNLSDGEW